MSKSYTRFGVGVWICVSMSFTGVVSGCSVRSGSVSSAASAINLSAKQNFDSGSGSWKLNYSLQLPADPQNIDFLELKEIDTSTTSNIDCTSGIPIKSWNSPFSASQVISGFYLAGNQDKFRYVFCATDKAGKVSTFADAGKQ